MSQRAKQIEQFAVLSIIALLVIGSIVMILPFLRAILWALVFAVTTWPLFIRVEKALGGRTSLQITDSLIFFPDARSSTILLYLAPQLA
jgi:predicted PurR-regulated permease PerM